MDITVIVLQSLLGLMFLMAGFSKLAGVKMHVENFNKWGLPQWFRIVTGLVQIIGAAALIVGYWEPSWTAVGGLIIGGIGLGGVLTHIRVKDTFKETMPILLLGVLGFVVFFLRLSDLSEFPGFN